MKAELTKTLKAEAVNHLADDPEWRRTGTQCPVCHDLFRENPLPAHACAGQAPSPTGEKR